MTVALIDADVIAHRAAAVGTDTVEWGDCEEGPTINPNLAINVAMDLIDKWVRPLHTKTILLCFSHRLNFRKALLSTYKANRRTPKVKSWKPIVAAMEDKYTSMRLPGLEADDVMGIMSTSPKIVDPIIVSIDKDMATIPGKLFNPDKMKRPIRIKPNEADYTWMLQTLCGDTTDNYKGIPGCGPVGAAKILEGAGEQTLEFWWLAVRQAFADKGINEGYAITQARMARILRREDYNKLTGEIRAWHPVHPTWLTVKEIEKRMPSVPTTTPGTQSSPSNTSSKTALGTVSGTSSSTSRGTRTKGGRSKTSRRQGATSIG